MRDRGFAHTLAVISRLSLVLAMSSATDFAQATCPIPQAPAAPTDLVSPTRQLRRITLALSGTTPTADHFAAPPTGCGVDVDIIEEDGSMSRRNPRAGDATATACRIMGMGLTDFFLPGGYGEVVGLRKT